MSESPYPSQNQDKFVLRLPDGMRDRIKAAAEASGRSMNAEIVSTLERAYPSLEGIDLAMDRITRMIIAAKSIGADHIIRDVELDLDRIVRDAMKEHRSIDDAIQKMAKHSAMPDD